MGIFLFGSLSFGVKLSEKLGIKVVIFCGGLSISLGFLIVSFISSFWVFVLIYCIMIGVASGLV